MKIPAEFFDKYREKINRVEYVIFDKDHIIKMMDTIPTIEDEGKMNRWLGFLQGWFYCQCMFTIDEMREHNRPYFQS